MYFLRDLGDFGWIVNHCFWLENASDESPIRRQGFTIPTTHSWNSDLFFGWSLLPFLRTDLDFVMYLDDDSCMATLESFKRIFLKDFKRKIQEVETFSTSTAWEWNDDRPPLTAACVCYHLDVLGQSCLWSGYLHIPRLLAALEARKIPHHETLSRSNDRVPRSLKGWWRWASSMKRSAIFQK